MQYITDEHKNITHVLVPIEEWNSMLEKQGSDHAINPYQSVIEWIESTLKDRSPNGKIPSLVGLSARIQGESLYVTLPVYNILRTILQNKMLISGERTTMKKFGGLDVLLSLMYPFALKADTKTIAVAYILRNDKFYKALHNTKTNITPNDLAVFIRYGFDIDMFKEEADTELLDMLYNGHKSEFIFTAMSSNITDFFSLSSIKERVRREPELLRLFFYDLFEALDEILDSESSFGEIFKIHPLVDKLAKAVYPSNTLSGSTSRVYKAAKEARTIIASDWQKYVSVN